MLDLLTKIAERGDLTAYSEACSAYVAVIPKSRRVLEDYSPVKILSGYVCRQPGVDQSKAEVWRAAEPRWSERIRDTLWTPARLIAVADGILAELRAISAPSRTNVRDEQMFLPVSRNHRCSSGRKSVHLEAVCRGAGLFSPHWENIGMIAGPPDRPRERRREVRRLEGMKTPGRRFRARLSRRRMKQRPLRRVTIGWIPPKPFPGEDRAIGFEQPGISGCVPPICLTIRSHPPRKAAATTLTHSPRWGNCVVEADPGVPEAIDHELGPADHIVSCARAFHIVMCGLDAEVENLRDLPIGLPGGKEAEALKLTTTEMRMSGLRGIIVDPAGGAEGMGSNELRVEQPLPRQMPPATHCERAGAIGLAGNIGGDREAVPDSEPAAPLKDASVPGIQRQQGPELGPWKADIGSNARVMDRVVMSQILFDEFVRPAGRIIVDPQKRTSAPLEAGMVKEREVAEAELHGHVCKQPAQVSITDATACLLLEYIDKARRLAAAQRGRCSGVRRRARLAGAEVRLRSSAAPIRAHEPEPSSLGRWAFEILSAHRHLRNGMAMTRL